MSWRLLFESTHYAGWLADYVRQLQRGEEAKEIVTYQVCEGGEERGEREGERGREGEKEGACETCSRSPTTMAGFMVTRSRPVSPRSPRLHAPPGSLRGRTIAAETGMGTGNEQCAIAGKGTPTCTAAAAAAAAGCHGSTVQRGASSACAGSRQCPGVQWRDRG